MPIAIISMVAADYFNPTTYTEKLKVPEGLTPSDPAARGWFISPSGIKSPVEPWVPFVAIVPAILVYILMFMETHISEYVSRSILTWTRMLVPKYNYKNIIDRSIGFQVNYRQKRTQTSKGQRLSLGYRTSKFH